MKVTVLQEAGFEEALRGMAYSYHDRGVPVDSWWATQRFKSISRADKLAHMEGGHNKFLESIQVWIDVEASRAWWSEMDTYRVGTTKQSESTMHTLAKRQPTEDDFEVGTMPIVIEAFKKVWEAAEGNINVLKMNLPEGFLQRRIVCTNYKVLRNIYKQRRGHRLKSWDIFLDLVVSQIENPKFIIN